MTQAKFDAILSVGFASITASYTALGAALTHNWRIFKITNNTDGDMMFSANGTTNNIFIPAGGFTLYDLAANGPNETVSSALQLAINTQFYIKYITAPTSGDVYIEGIYAKGF